jgi:predicted TIM-barrel enzyme
VSSAVITMDQAIERTNAIIAAARRVRSDIFFLSHGGPISAPADAAAVNQQTACVGFVGASSLERMGVEQSLVDITRRFKAIPCPGGRTFVRSTRRR